MNRSKEKLWRRGVALALYAVGTGLLILVGLIIYVGGRWSGTVAGVAVTVSDPRGRLLLAVLSFMCGRFISSGAPFNLRQVGVLAGKLVLLAISLAISWFVAEKALRHILRANESSGNFRQLESFHHGEVIPVREASSLATIVRVSPNKRLVYELTPNLDRNFGHYSLKTNSDGMRESRDYSREKPEDVIRIIGIGDSGMFGWACHQGESFLDMLEENLGRREGSKRYEVLNMAVPGYNTFQEVEILRYRGTEFSPDIVILHWCHNDVLPSFFLMKQREYREEDVFYLYLLLFNREQFRRLTRPEVMKLNDIDPDYIDPKVLEYSGPEGVFKSLQELKQLSQERGFNVLIFGPLPSALIRACELLGFEYLSSFDLRQEDYPDANIHGMHPRPKANRILAEFIEQKLDQLGWLN